MPIPETKLATWANLYETQAAQNGHLAVRRAIELHRPSSWRAQVDDFLQGSYRNATSVFRDSDVDLVLQWNGGYFYDISALSTDEVARFNSEFVPADYRFDAYRNDVIDALRRHFGWQDVDTTGNKALRVAPKPGERLAADVIPCFEFRRYRSYGPDGPTYDIGIAFETQYGGRRIVNYPKQHIENGWRKNAEADGWYKSSVRIYKNARNHLVDSGRLLNGAAPSYFVECLLYNVPATEFGGDHVRSFLKSLLWLLKTDLSGATCQNGLVPLFGDTDEQWNLPAARVFLDALLELESNWT